MVETLREPVVVLSLESSNFSRNTRTINVRINEAESASYLAGGRCGELECRNGFQTQNKDFDGWVKGKTRSAERVM